MSLNLNIFPQVYNLWFLIRRYFRELADCNSSATLVESAKQQDPATDAQERLIDFDGWKSIYNKVL